MYPQYLIKVGIFICCTVPCVLHAQDVVHWSELYIGGEDQLVVPFCDIVPEFCMPSLEIPITDTIADTLSVVPVKEGIAEPFRNFGDIGIDNQFGERSLFITDPESVYLSEGHVWIIVPVAGGSGYAEAFLAATGQRPDQDFVPICGIQGIFCKLGPVDIQIGDFDGSKFGVDVHMLLNGQAQGLTVIRVNPQDLYINEGMATVAPNGGEWLMMERP